MATAGFDKFAPGFDFLQNLAQNAGSAMPHIGQWVAPTLDPAELDKRIQELRTVQFWLEQNSRMIATTIQALEVQRMTLSTLKTMNVQMGELRDSLKAGAAPATAGAKKAADPAAPIVDPMQWWNALAEQFTQLAASAAKPPAASSATAPASAPGAAKKAARKTASRKAPAPKGGR
jgi:hypothetical protein